MLDETLAKLETHIRESDAIQADKKAKLLSRRTLVTDGVSLISNSHTF
jgi:hypothetical protein